MSFKFDHQVFNNKHFNELVKEKLNKKLSKPSQDCDYTNDYDDDDIANTSRGSKSILTNGITVNNVNFAKPPFVEILDLSVQPKNAMAKSIIKILLESASIEISTNIEANSLLFYSSNSTPEFLMPEIMCNDSFVVPITMLFSNIHLEAISNISMDKKTDSGISVSFNDVNLDFDFDCSIKLFQGAIEKRLKSAMDSVFKEVLPVMIYTTSYKSDDSSTASSSASASASSSSSSSSSSTVQDDCITNGGDKTNGNITFLDSRDLEDFNPITMLKLSTMVSQRNSLSLIGSQIEGCLERPNLYKLIQKKSLQLSNLINKTYYSSSPRKASSSNFINNALPIEGLDFNKNGNVVKNIADLQSSIYAKQSRKQKTQIKRRVINLKKKTTTVTQDTNEKEDAIVKNDAVGNKKGVETDTQQKLPSTPKSNRDNVSSTPSSPLKEKEIGLMSSSSSSSSFSSTKKNAFNEKVENMGSAHKKIENSISNRRNINAPKKIDIPSPRSTSPILRNKHRWGSIVGYNSPISEASRFITSRVSSPLPSPSPVPALKFHHWVEDHAMGQNSFKPSYLSFSEDMHSSLMQQGISVPPVSTNHTYTNNNHYSFVGISSQIEHPQPQPHEQATHNDGNMVNTHADTLLNDAKSITLSNTHSAVKPAYEKKHTDTNMDASLHHHDSSAGVIAPPPPYTRGF